MGSSALDSHSKGKKHAAKVKEHSSMSLDCFFFKKPVNKSSDSEMQSTSQSRQRQLMSTC